MNTYDRYHKQQLRRQYWLKAQVYFRLGGKCAHCNNTDYRVLTIDHIDSDATQDMHCWEGTTGKNRDSKWYMKIYKFLNQVGKYPHNLQLLCFNCHMIKDNYDGKTFKQYCEDRVAPLKMEDYRPR